MAAPEIASLASLKPDHASIVVTADGVEYFAEAPRYSDPTAAVWSCRAAFPIAAGAGKRIKHVSGLKAPGVDGENLPGFTYE